VNLAVLIDVKDAAFTVPYVFAAVKWLIPVDGCDRSYV
jgi:hypothetical protein